VARGRHWASDWGEAVTVSAAGRKLCQTTVPPFLLCISSFSLCTTFLSPSAASYCNLIFESLYLPTLKAMHSIPYITFISHSPYSLYPADCAADTYLSHWKTTALSSYWQHSSTGIWHHCWLYRSAISKDHKTFVFWLKHAIFLVLFKPEDKGITTLCNGGNYWPNNPASHSRRQGLSAALLRESAICTACWFPSAQTVTWGVRPYTFAPNVPGSRQHRSAAHSFTSPATKR
jgi:hypothetical protein